MWSETSLPRRRRRYFHRWGHLRSAMNETAVETEGDFLARIPKACENIHKSRISERCARTWCFSVMLAMNSVASASCKFYELNENNISKII